LSFQLVVSLEEASPVGGYPIKLLDR